LEIFFSFATPALQAGLRRSALSHLTLVVDDTTSGACGKFVGTSTGGTVSSNSSKMQINWTAPSGLQIGPGTNNTASGNFGPTIFGAEDTWRTRMSARCVTT